MNGDDDNLLLASTVPIPEDSDSDPEESANLMSFSTPFELYPPNLPAPKSNSHARSFSLKSGNDSALTMSNAVSNPEHTQGEIVEDALRARAEQAESAAERLLELVEPEENGIHHSTIPASLLLGSNGDATPKPHSKATPGPVKRARTVPQPVTPLNRNANILRQASLFKNSPAYNGTSPSLLDVLKDRKNETSWWLKRMNST
jgi:CLIP-associating protein 1/2